MELYLYSIIVVLTLALLWLLLFKPSKPQPQVIQQPPPAPPPAPTEVIIIPVPIEPPIIESQNQDPQAELPFDKPRQGLKHCPHCGKNRKKSSFYRSTKTADGLTKWCKYCHRQYRKQR
ncbi:MAG: hypothetical protein Q4G28_02565 [Neisseria sp.]|nr:hypothetical protein [Neisseria sp.]